MNNKITFGKLQNDGMLMDVKMISQSDIVKCPFLIFMPDHYREDGTCKCSNAEHRKMMIKEWGYKKSNFKNIVLVD